MFNLANKLLGMIWEKVPAIALKWSSMPKVSTYRYSEDCYTESFCIICSSPTSHDSSHLSCRD
ncbi:MAG: hypothetical protein DWQ56_16690 [Microcystis aeruginosa DA14]|uniref:Uncharacterized protein n=1 Tax=Microcystis aeruginosa DA14 TaxID=1987506 RepID=A0A3E0M4Q5_MICAE|nr:MAG: hypothetical protein DWQ56_16690 [Microcystis aeruginosa DA14]